MFPTWASVYKSDLQGFWALVIVPALFLLWRWLAAGPPGPGVEPRRSRFVERWARLFALETIADPVITGPLGLHQALVPFVLLGDFRVFLLVFAVGWRERAIGNVVIAAARWTLIVPIVAWLGFRLLTMLHGPVDLTVLWLFYEVAFLILATWLRQRWVPATVGPDRAAVRRYLRAVLAYVMLYYALWVAADVLILAGVDAGWGLRIVPNQLYYAFWVPFAWGLFMARSQDATSVSVQAAR